MHTELQTKFVDGQSIPLVQCAPHCCLVSVSHIDLSRQSKDVLRFFPMRNYDVSLFAGSHLSSISWSCGYEYLKKKRRACGRGLYDNSEIELLVAMTSTQSKELLKL